MAYSILLVLCFLMQLSTQASVAFPQSVINFMATRERRYMHYLWHNIRDNWNFYSPETQADLTNLGWHCPRPSRGVDEYGNLMVLTENNSGEDFLYMHMKMIETVNAMTSATPYGPLTGWSTIPVKNLTGQVPAGYTIPGMSATASAIRNTKTNRFYINTLHPKELDLTDPDELRSLTLGQLGSICEITAHNMMHLRFSAESTYKYGYRPAASGAVPIIDEKWDDPEYNWLGDTYSSHVNPMFWNVHMWVNNTIKAWMDANGKTDYAWIGTWTGGPIGNIATAKLTTSTTITSASMRVPSTMSISRSSGNNTLQKVLEALSKEKVKESSFTDVLTIRLPKKKARKNMRRI